MNLRFKLDLDAFLSYPYNLIVFTFYDLSNKENFSSTYESATTLGLSSVGTNKVVNIGTTILTGNDIKNISNTQTYVTFNANVGVNDMKILSLLIKNNVLTIISEGTTVLFTFRLNDEKDKVNKTLTSIGYLEGNFKAPLGVKNIEFDVINYDVDNTYNYVFIPKLRRYYYITNIQFANKDFTRLILQEDVLMSWAELIKQQSGFITRYQYSSRNDLVDDRLPLENIVTDEYIDCTTILAPNNKRNCAVNLNLIDNIAPFILMSAYVEGNWQFKNQANSPVTDLPKIPNTVADSIFGYFISLKVYKDLYSACQRDDATASYITNVMLLPLNPFGDPYGMNIYPTPYIDIHVKDKKLEEGGYFTPISQSASTPILQGRQVYYTNPYLIIAHFIYNPSNVDFTYYGENSKYEIYVPFCSWVSISAEKLINKEILVYYSIDIESGLANAYIYSVTDKAVLWTASCQIGIKLPINTTNALENTKQKQSNDLSMGIGLISSALSIGVGVVSENPIAVAGGVLSAGKTIANAVNSNRMLIEKMNVSFGSGLAGAFSPTGVYIRRSYHKKITLDNSSTYNQSQGKPYNNYSDLTSLTGYVEVADIHFDAKSYNIYNDEIVEIVALLKNGVIL